MSVSRFRNKCKSSNTSRHFILIFTIGISFLCLRPILASEHRSIEYKIKAGYLYNFTKFITWPKFQSETFNLCIIGIDPFGKLLDPLENKSVLGKPIRLVRQTKYPRNIQCHIAYIKPEPFQYLQSKTQSETDITTLVVSDQAELSQTNAVISFILVDNKVKLQIDLLKLRASGLSISANLLEVAEIVREAKQ